MSEMLYLCANTFLCTNTFLSCSIPFSILWHVWHRFAWSDFGKPMFQPFCLNFWPSLASLFLFSDNSDCFKSSDNFALYQSHFRQICPQHITIQSLKFARWCAFILLSTSPNRLIGRQKMSVQQAASTLMLKWLLSWSRRCHVFRCHFPEDL